MANCAIVIGVDRYTNSDWNLDGAVADALAFADWALSDGEVPRENLRLLLSGDADTDLVHGDATARSITQVLFDFSRGAGAGADRLFMYYSGHGLSAPGATETGGVLEPMLIPSDVRELPVDSRLCIPFSEIMPLLRTQPPQKQFFFLDACRDFSFAGYRPAVALRSAAWTLPSEPGLSSDQYVLYATSPGQRAQEDKALKRAVFGTTLLEGLRGAPGAALWNGSEYDITFARLAEFVKTTTRKVIEAAVPDEWQRYMQEPMFDARGSSNPILATVPPFKMAPVEVKLRLGPSAAREACALRLLYSLPDVEIAAKTGTHGPPVEKRTTKLKVPPFDYTIEAESPTFKRFRIPLRAWGDVSAKIELIPETVVSSAAPESGPGALRISCDDPSATITVFDAGFRRIDRARGAVSRDDLTPGVYTVRLTPVDGRAVDQHVEVRPGAPTEVSLQAAGLQLGADQRRVLKAAGVRTDRHGFVHASKALEPLAGARLGTLLAQAAFATFTPDAPGFDALRKLGLGAGLEPAAGAAGVLVVAGASGSSPVPDVSAADFARLAQIRLRDLEGQPLGPGTCEPLAGMSFVATTQLALEPGCFTAELRLPGLAPTRYALASLPDRVTVLIAVAEDAGGVDVQQYMLAVGGRSGLPSGGLTDGHDVRRLDVAQRHYSQGVALTDVDDLLYGKWLDPLLGALAGYALIKAGQEQRYIGRPANHDGLQQSAMRNMLNFFGALPDSHVLAGLCEPTRKDEHFARALAIGLPVFAEGFRPLFEWYREFDGRHARPIWIDPAALVPGSPWTAWVAERPAIAVSNAKLSAIPPGWGALARSRDRVEQAVAATGSVHVAGEFRGTAFAIAPGVVITAAHVCRDAAATDVSIRFGDTVDTGPTFAGLEYVARIERDDAHPLVVLRTSGGAQSPTPLPLANVAPAPAEGRRVFVVGFPMPDAHVPPDVQERVFGSSFGVKRVQPGQLLMVERDATVLRHDCLTLGGNGGSPVVDLDSGLVLGVHYAGRWLEYKRGDAVPLWPLLDNESLRPFVVWSSYAED